MFAQEIKMICLAIVLSIGPAIVLLALLCAILDVRGHFDEQAQIKIEPAPLDARQLPAQTETANFEIVE